MNSSSPTSACSKLRANFCTTLRAGVYRTALAALILLCGLSALPSRAQQAPAGSVGRLEGNDISVQDGTPAGRNTATVAPSIYVANGSVMTVHSGDARLMLAAGGEIDICGPAKLTLLEANGSLTVALNFGQVRVRLPETVKLQIFTPTIVGTPIGIGDAARDVTLGLSLDDSLCVLASSGAIQLEHQFTAEKMIVPQAGEFFLAEGKLLPVAGKPGSCRCQELQTQPEKIPLPSPSLAVTAPAPLTAPPEIAQTPPVSASAIPAQSQPNVEFSIPVHPDETRPRPMSPNRRTPVWPPADLPVYTVVAPPLVFTAGSPQPPPEPPLNTFLLVRETRVDPQWEFNGHVDPPEFVKELQKALGEVPSDTPGSLPEKAAPERRKSGFWGFVRKIF